MLYRYAGIKPDLSRHHPGNGPMESTMTCHVYDSSHSPPKDLFLISLLVMTSDLQARVSKLCTGKFLVSCISWRKKSMYLQRFGAFPKSWCPEIAADVLGISFLAKLPGAEVPPRELEDFAHDLAI